jgi:hypothetical protein
LPKTTKFFFTLDDAFPRDHKQRKVLGNPLLLTENNITEKAEEEDCDGPKPDLLARNVCYKCKKYKKYALTILFF